MLLNRVARSFCGRKLLRLCGKFLFCHETFAVGCDGPKDYTYMYDGMKFCRGSYSMKSVNVSCHRILCYRVHNYILYF